MRTVLLIFALVLASGAYFEHAGNVIDDVYEATLEDLAAQPLEYYSDYFSFIGEDAHGHVAFAIDINRGRDGGEYQAEHFVVLHDEHHGWIDTAGSGAFEPATRNLNTVTNSETFQFHGQPENGIRISSNTNGLSLTVDPVPVIYSRQKGLAKIWMGSAKATLQWREREIDGRVIYENLYLPAFNRLSRTYLGLWADFHGIYVKVGDVQDLYIHSQRSPLLAPLVGREAGFVLLSSGQGEIDDLEMSVTNSKVALGLYRWPQAWIGSFDFKKSTYTFELELEDRVTIVNWVLGGFSMGILKGWLTQGQNRFPLLGIGELLI